MCMCIITVQEQLQEGRRPDPPLLLLPLPWAAPRPRVGLRPSESTTTVGLGGYDRCEEAGKYR
jgi:hypothetical protein